jgi:hypothetical protein
MSGFRWHVTADPSRRQERTRPSSSELRHLGCSQAGATLAWADVAEPLMQLNLPLCVLVWRSASPLKSTRTASIVSTKWLLSRKKKP